MYYEFNKKKVFHTAGGYNVAFKKGDVYPLTVRILKKGILSIRKGNTRLYTEDKDLYKALDVEVNHLLAKLEKPQPYHSTQFYQGEWSVIKGKQAKIGKDSFDD